MERADPRDDSVADVLALAAERIREIVEAAERASKDIRFEVDSKLGGEQVDSSRINRERLVAELSESLLERADGLSRDAAGLAELLDRAGGRLAKLGASDAARPVEERGPRPAEQRPSPPDSPRTEGPDSSSTLTQRVSDRFSERMTPSASPPGFRRKSMVSGKRPRPQASTEGLRLLATQMAVAGSSREEIEGRLRDEFGVSDPGPLLGDSVAGGFGGRLGEEREHG